MTIDWTQAPPWARYAAMDADGFWFWYASRPTALSTVWRCPQNTEFELIDLPDWTQTLTERPTE